MKDKETLFQRSKVKIRFQNEDMDFIFQWMIGYGAYGGLDFGEMFAIARHIDDKRPETWVQAFSHFGKMLDERASALHQGDHRRSEGETYLKAACAYRAALQMMSPHQNDFRAMRETFKDRFRQAMRLLEITIEPVNVPYAGKTLPGYFARAGEVRRPTLVMIGGGDTYCEDLYFFAGAGGLARGYHTLMVDLPGQGDTPLEGLYFDVEFEKPIAAVIDYALTRIEIDPERLAMMGISGGGFMVTRAAAYEKRLKAVIADTPIYDMGRVLDAEIPSSLLHAPSAVGHLLVKVAGMFNAAGRVNMDKYVWQAGMADPLQAMALGRKGRVDIGRVHVPMLCLAGEGDPPECLVQMQTAYDRNPSPHKALRIFTIEEGADAHCQVNNLRLLHQVVFDWLDQVLVAPPSAT